MNLSSTGIFDLSMDEDQRKAHRRMVAKLQIRTVASTLPREEQALEIVKKRHPEPVSARQLAEALGIARQGATIYLNALVRRGSLERCGRGSCRYQYVYKLVRA